MPGHARVMQGHGPPLLPHTPQQSKPASTSGIVDARKNSRRNAQAQNFIILSEKVKTIVILIEEYINMLRIS